MQRLSLVSKVHHTIGFFITLDSTGDVQLDSSSVTTQSSRS